MVSTSTVYEPETTWIKIYISVLLPSKCLLPLYFVYFISKKKKLYFGPVIFSSVTDVLETILLFGYLCSLQSQPESISETLRFWNAHTGTLCYKHCNQIENIKHPQSWFWPLLCWWRPVRLSPGYLVFLVTGLGQARIHEQPFRKCLLLPCAKLYTPPSSETSDISLWRCWT